MRRIVHVVVTLAVGVACGGTVVRTPNVPESPEAQALQGKIGAQAQNCGEVVEPKTDATCGVHPIGECLMTALRNCRAAYGNRTYFTAESDAMRIDWFVVPEAQGGACRLAVVEDRSADPLAPRTPTTKTCKSIVWKPHETIPACQAPVADGCAAEKPAQ